MKAKLLTLLAVLLCATTAWAQTTVKTDQELRAAIQINNVDIKLLADLNLSNSTLSIAEGMTVTIDLDGHALDRKLTKRGEGGGQVITVRKGATLNLKNGTLKGGFCTVCGVQMSIGTGIETMSDGRSKMSDGRSKMSDAWYDLQGRKLNFKPTQKGVYINNGKIRVIK